MARHTLVVELLLAMVLFSSPSSSQESIGWSLTGGKPWEDRVGAGVSLAVGGNDCTDDYCDDQLDTRLLGSFGTTLGGFYRIIPNLVVFLDFHVAYMNTDYTALLRDDRGFLFQVTGGAELHTPFTGWFEAYAGLGFGYALLRAKGQRLTDGAERVESLRGVNFELKIGADVYLFSRVPTLGFGPLFRLGFVVWPTACVHENKESVCDDPDVLGERDDMAYIDETPFLVFIGLAARYGF